MLQCSYILTNRTRLIGKYYFPLLAGLQNQPPPKKSTTFIFYFLPTGQPPICPGSTPLQTTAQADTQHQIKSQATPPPPQNPHTPPHANLPGFSPGIQTWQNPNL